MTIFRGVPVVRVYVDEEVVGYKQLCCIWPWRYKNGDTIQLRSPVFQDSYWKEGKYEDPHPPNVAGVTGIYAYASQADARRAMNYGSVFVKVLLSGRVIEHSPATYAAPCPSHGYRAQRARVVEVRYLEELLPVDHIKELKKWGRKNKIPVHKLGKWISY